MKEMFSKTPPPPPPKKNPLEITAKPDTFLKFLGLTDPTPTPQKFFFPSVGENGYFLQLHNL